VLVILIPNVIITVQISSVFSSHEKNGHQRNKNQNNLFGVIQEIVLKNTELIFKIITISRKVDFCNSPVSGNVFENDGREVNRRMRKVGQREIYSRNKITVGNLSSTRKSLQRRFVSHAHVASYRVMSSENIVS